MNVYLPLLLVFSLVCVAEFKGGRGGGGRGGGMSRGSGSRGFGRSGTAKSGSRGFSFSKLFSRNKSPNTSNRKNFTPSSSPRRSGPSVYLSGNRGSVGGSGIVYVPGHASYGAGATYHGFGYNRGYSNGYTRGHRSRNNCDENRSENDTMPTGANGEMCKVGVLRRVWNWLFPLKTITFSPKIPTLFSVNISCVGGVQFEQTIFPKQNVKLQYSDKITIECNMWLDPDEKECSVSIPYTGRHSVVELQPNGAFLAANQRDQETLLCKWQVGGNQTLIEAVLAESTSNQ